jgi:hypothetical protein
VLKITPRLINQEKMQSAGMRNDKIFRPHGLAARLLEVEIESVDLTKAEGIGSLHLQGDRWQFGTSVYHAIREPTGPQRLATIGATFSRNDLGDLRMIDTGMDFGRR